MLLNVLSWSYHLGIVTFGKINIVAIKLHILPHLDTIYWELKAASFLSVQLSSLRQMRDPQEACQNKVPDILHTDQFLKKKVRSIQTVQDWFLGKAFHTFNALLGV